MKAIWNNQILAESEDTVVVEGNHYFPVESINRAFFKDSNTQSVCPWKGTASYFSIEVNNETNADAAWYYKDPSDRAREIKNRVAFWKGVKITE